VDLDSPGAIATFANWIVNWVPPAFDLGFAVLSKWLPQSKKSARVMQFVDPAGVFTDAAIAVATLITGMVESGVADENAVQWSSNSFLPWGTITLPIRSVAAVQYKPLEPYLLWLLPVKLGFDVISVGGAVFKFAWMPSLREARRSAVAV
jgi:hypothetical protein